MSIYFNLICYVEFFQRIVELRSRSLFSLKHFWILHADRVVGFLIFTLNTQRLYIASDIVGDISGVVVWFRVELAKLWGSLAVCLDF